MSDITREDLVAAIDQLMETVHVRSVRIAELRVTLERIRDQRVLAGTALGDEVEAQLKKPWWR